MGAQSIGLKHNSLVSPASGVSHWSRAQTHARTDQGKARMNLGVCLGSARLCKVSHLAMGQNPNRNPGEHPIQSPLK